MLAARRNVAWRDRRQALQEAIPDSFWTALDCYDDGSWTAYTPGFAYEVAEREVSQRSAFAEAERRIARTIRAMYEVGHRLPAASLTLEAAQQEDERNREAYEALEDRVREGDASTSGGGPKVVERQWLRVHVDLSLADSLDEDPLVRRAVEPLVVTYGEEPDDEDSDLEEERADMAEDEDANPWTGLPRVSAEDEGDPIEPETSARGAEIDSMRPYLAMEVARAELLEEAQHLREARSAAAAAGEPMPADEVAVPGGGMVSLSDAERILARAYNIGYNLNHHGAPAVAGPAVRHSRHTRLGGSTGQMGRRTGQDRSTAANSTLSGLTAQLRAQNAAFLPRRAAASWKQGEASLR
ncbi:g9977 [Coccomyxa elongata]